MLALPVPFVKRSFIISLILLVTLPIIGLAWLGWRMLDGERARLRENFTQVMQQRLAEVNTTLTDSIGRIERRLSEKLTLGDFSHDSLRTIARREPLMAQVFVIDPQGKRAFPPPDPNLCSNEELEFLNRSAEIWRSGERLDRAMIEAGPQAQQGWKIWYHGGTTRFWFWQRQPINILAGAEVPTAVLMAELLNDLPSGGDHTAAFQVLDAQGQEIYSWGTPSEHPVKVTRPAPHPFSTWQVTCAMPDVVQEGSLTWKYQLLIGLACASLLLGLVAYYLYRESSREIRQAGQRVSFVNQVSHELKTPLTNISLYTELAAQKLPAESSDVHEYLEIVTSESARLGRLIGNVLSFSKHEHGQVQPRLAACDVVSLLQRIAEQFRPALTNKNLRLEIEAPSALTVTTDADMVEQIIGNLLSNVEKYGFSGGVAWLRLTATDKEWSVCVDDSGPGIPTTQRERIFHPFVRLSDKLSDGITGTGIGLSIARDLAHLLRGTLQCTCPPKESAGTGARFILTLPLT